MSVSSRLTKMSAVDHVPPNMLTPLDINDPGMSAVLNSQYQIPRPDSEGLPMQDPQFGELSTLASLAAARRYERPKFDFFSSGPDQIVRIRDNDPTQRVPFQVAGRPIHRLDIDIDEDDHTLEDVARVFGYEQRERTPEQIEEDRQAYLTAAEQRFRDTSGARRVENTLGGAVLGLGLGGLGGVASMAAGNPSARTFGALLGAGALGGGTLGYLLTKREMDDTTKRNLLNRRRRRGDDDAISEQLALRSDGSPDQVYRQLGMELPPEPYWQRADRFNRMVDRAVSAREAEMAAAREEAEAEREQTTWDAHSGWRL